MASKSVDWCFEAGLCEPLQGTTSAEGIRTQGNDWQGSGSPCLLKDNCDHTTILETKDMTEYILEQLTSKCRLPDIEP